MKLQKGLLYACMGFWGIFSVTPGHAQCTCSGCSGGLTSFVTPGSSSLRISKNKWMADASFDFVNLSYSGIRIYDEEMALSNGILKNASVSTIGASYGISDHLMVSVHQPYVRIQSAYKNEKTSCLSDASAMAVYSFTLNKSESLMAGVNGGFRIPTGGRMIINNFSVAVSTGSFDPMAGASISYTHGRYSLSGFMNYTYSLAGFENIVHGNIFIHETSLRYTLRQNKEERDTLRSLKRNNSSFQLEAGLRGERLMPQTFNNETLQNTGNYIIYLHGGIKMQLNKHLCVPFTVYVPVFEEVQGFQNVPHLRLNCSVQYLF